jgi:hypothetical protein
MRFTSLTCLFIVSIAISPAPIPAQLVSPQIGWRAELSRDFHDVSGTVTIVDDDTIRVDDFTFDGGGISVYFYLGAEDTRSSFTSGLGVGPELVGTVFDGSQPPLVIDLRPGQTLEGWHAISVWCVDVNVSFGSGTFMAVSPLIPGDFDNGGALDITDIDELSRQSAGGLNDPTYDLNGDSLVNSGDIDVWVRDLFHGWIGDANLDGQFESGDLVQVFAAGQYEDSATGNSSWRTGDWNGDGEFTTSDMIRAFQDGGYDRGVRASVAAVPEPSGFWWPLTVALMAARQSRCRNQMFYFQVVDHST